MLDLRKVFSRSFRGKMMDALRFLPDKPYLQLFFFACNWKFLNFENPTTFCDKLNWMKLYDRHPEYAKYVDKLAVRDYIIDTLGEEYVFPIHGVWKSFDEINFSELPDAFVLKCNHDSGSVRIIKDKNQLSQKEMDELKKFYDRRLKYDFFYAGREYSYKGIKPFIFAEKYMQNEDSDTETFFDYKFMCFDGVPKFMYIETERSVGVKMNCFDMDFKPLDIIGDKSEAQHEFVKSPNFDEMKEIAARLSQGMRFVRIDFREVNGQIYFGEFTFYENGGFRPYRPEAWDLKIASWIDLKK